MGKGERTLLIVLGGLAAAVLFAGAGFLVARATTNDATPGGPIPSAPAVTGEQETPTGEPTVLTETGTLGTETTPGDVTYQVWFSLGETLFVTYRTQEATPAVGRAAVEALLDGPSSFERGYGLTSSVPDGTRLLGLTIADGVADVDLTSEFESGGGSLSMQMRLAQLVYTLTQFRTVDSVRLSLDGEPVEVIGGEGVILDHPLTRTRREYRELLPVILVVRPGLRETVSSPVLVRGSANVFEANVTVKILDENGDTIAETFTTATCGTGCRGTYRVEVPFEVDRAQDGTIVVHDDDAAGTGTPPHEVRIPVRLVPR